MTYPSSNIGQLPSKDSLSVVLASDQSNLAVGGNTVTCSTTLIRPSDTTAYSAKDCVSNSTSATTPITFTNAARIAGGTGYITKALLLSNQSTHTSNIRLWLYHASNVTVAVDNAPFTIMWANATPMEGYIDFPALTTEGTGGDSAYALCTGSPLAFNCATGDRNLYGVLETLTAFTPASGQKFFIEITSEQN